MTTTSNAQNLEFSKVIDTVITLTIGNSPQNIGTKHLGQTLSPPSGKVWKVNNILLDAGEVINDYSNGIYNCFFCNDPNQDRNDIKFGVDIYDGANEFDVRMMTPDVATNTAHADPYISVNSFPLWMNSSSTIRTFMIQQSETTTNADICVKNVFSKAYISILEFNVE